MMNIGISCSLDDSLLTRLWWRRRRKCWGLIPSGWESTRSCPCTAPRLRLAPLGAASLISIVDSWTPSWPWPGLLVTTRLKLGTGITLVPGVIRSSWRKRSPPGLLLQGPVSLWHRRRLEQRRDGAYGRQFRHRWTQTREAIEAMKALWANEAAEYHGTLLRLSARALLPAAGAATPPAHLSRWCGAAGVQTQRRLRQWLDAHRGTPG